MNTGTSGIEKGISGLLDVDIDKVVFFGSTALILPFILLGAFFPELLGKMAKASLAWITSTWGWLYLSSVNGFVLVGLLIALSPLGLIRLGQDDERPEFSRLSWFAMLFSAGMGIGLVFWSIAEPMYHLASPPVGQPETAESARLAFSIFFHHWGVHAWGTYVAVGLPIAYFRFRKKRPGTISACLEPFFKDEKGKGKLIGNIVDILAVWATVMGVVTSLGLGALQISSGLSISFGIQDGSFTTGAVIVAVTFLFVLSALSGVKRGIKYLSLFNVLLMVLLLFFFLVFGPFAYLMKTFFIVLADYLKNIIPLSTTLVLFNNESWTRSWTVFYWAWWIAWAPFVGAFIAGISRGRTVREFILMVMFVPALFSFMFSAALGGTAVHMQLFEHIPLLETVAESVEAALFKTLHHLPFPGFIGLLANLLIASFFVTSADSATFVICQFSTGGKAGKDGKSGRVLIIFWGMVLGGLALVLIFSGGLKALQTASIAGALPFVFVMYVILAATVYSMVAERKGFK